jgi:hypothetical protein
MLCLRGSGKVTACCQRCRLYLTVAEALPAFWVALCCLIACTDVLSESELSIHELAVSQPLLAADLIVSMASRPPAKRARTR